MWYFNKFDFSLLCQKPHAQVWSLCLMQPNSGKFQNPAQGEKSAPSLKVLNTQAMDGGLEWTYPPPPEAVRKRLKGLCSRPSPKREFTAVLFPRSYLDLRMSCSFCSVDKILHIWGREKGPLSMEKESKTFKGDALHTWSAELLQSCTALFSSTHGGWPCPPMPWILVRQEGLAPFKVRKNSLSPLSFREGESSFPLCKAFLVRWEQFSLPSFKWVVQAGILGPQCVKVLSRGNLSVSTQSTSHLWWVKTSSSTCTTFYLKALFSSILLFCSFSVTYLFAINRVVRWEDIVRDKDIAWNEHPQI